MPGGDKDGIHLASFHSVHLPAYNTNLIGRCCSLKYLASEIIPMLSLLPHPSTSYLYGLNSFDKLGFVKANLNPALSIFLELPVPGLVATLATS
jgi:hypothetical protein